MSTGKVIGLINALAGDSGSGGGSSGGGVLVVTVDNQTWTLDKTWQEIYDAASTSAVVLVYEQNEAKGQATLATVQAEGFGAYYVAYFMDNGQRASYYTTSANGYPTYGTPPNGDSGGLSS